MKELTFELLRKRDIRVMRGMLTDHPEFQAGAIAAHYLRCIRLAELLLKLTELRNEINPATRPKATEDIIEQVVRQIKEAHASDLGIELTWEDEK